MGQPKTGQKGPKKLLGNGHNLGPKKPQKLPEQRGSFWPTPEKSPKKPKKGPTDPQKIQKFEFRAACSQETTPTPLRGVSAGFMKIPAALLAPRRHTKVQPKPFSVFSLQTIGRVADSYLKWPLLLGFFEEKSQKNLQKSKFTGARLVNPRFGIFQPRKKH